MSDNPNERRGWFERTFHGVEAGSGAIFALILVGAILFLIISSSLRSWASNDGDPDPKAISNDGGNYSIAEMEAAANSLDAAADNAMAAAANAADAAAASAQASTVASTVNPAAGVASDLNELSHDAYVTQCIDAMERGNEPAVMSLPPSDRRAMCEASFQADRQAHSDQ